jgi:hypothetical protein
MKEMKTLFKNLQINDKFHAGKDTRYKIYRKSSKSIGTCVEVINFPDRLIGGGFSFSANSIVWKIEE